MFGKGIKVVGQKPIVTLLGGERAELSQIEFEDNNLHLRFKPLKVKHSQVISECYIEHPWFRQIKELEPRIYEVGDTIRVTQTLDMHM